MRINIEITTDQDGRSQDEHADVVLRTIRAAVANRLKDTRVSGVSWREE